MVRFCFWLCFFKTNTRKSKLVYCWVTWANRCLNCMSVFLVSLQAMIGVAFSLGFTLGPMIGAYLAMEAERGEVFYLRSALLALVFAVADLIFIFFLLPETLPKEKRVSGLCLWRNSSSPCKNRLWELLEHWKQGAEAVSQELSLFLGLEFNSFKLVSRELCDGPTF